MSGSPKRSAMVSAIARHAVRRLLYLTGKAQAFVADERAAAEERRKRPHLTELNKRRRRAE